MKPQEASLTRPGPPAPLDGRPESYVTWLTDPQNRTTHLVIMVVVWAVALTVHYISYLPPLSERLGDLRFVWLHVVHQAVFVLLVIYCSLVFRLKGGLIAVALTSLASLPLVFRSYLFGIQPHSQETLDLLMQVAFIVFMGTLATVLYEAVSSERERFAVLASQVEQANRELQTKSRELEQVIQELQSSRRRIVGAQQETRREIAERLHGNVQSRLLVATQLLRDAQERGAATPEGSTLIVKAADMIDDVNQNDLRGIARRLHPSIVRLGLGPALRSLADAFRSSFEVEIKLDEKVAAAETPGTSLLPEETRLAAYRVVEEALNNVQKHAGATAVHLSVEWPMPDRLAVSVRDNGRGFDTQNTRAGLGLLSMRDYASLQGGTMEIQSRPGLGTTIRATFPLPATLAGVAAGPKA